MELEAKHLTPYLPHRLKLQYVVRGEVEKIGIMRSISYNDSETHPTRVSIDGQDEEHIWLFRPILKRMRNLNDENIVKLKLFIEADREYVIENPLNCCYDDLQYLISGFYDVFNLIENNLADPLN